MFFSKIIINELNKVINYCDLNDLIYIINLVKVYSVYVYDYLSFLVTVA